MTEADQQGQEAAEERAGVWRREVWPLFTGGTQFLSGLVTGSIEVLRRVIGAGIRQALGMDVPQVLMIIWVGGGGAATYIIRPYTTGSITVLLGAGLVGALWFSPAPAGDEEREQETDDEADPADQSADPSAVHPEEFIQLLHDAIGDDRGIHLATLAEDLADHYPGEWDVAAVRALCTAAGVPVRPTVRAPGRGPTVGVHKDDLPPLPHADSDPAL